MALPAQQKVHKALHQAAHVQAQALIQARTEAVGHAPNDVHVVLVILALG